MATSLIDLSMSLDGFIMLLGDGVRLFDHLGAAPLELERFQVIETPGVTHLMFRVSK
jgi:hypothetical protein